MLSVGIIGGGALASQWGLRHETIQRGTPYGEPSSAVVRMELNEHVTAYAILRHGERHSLGHDINYRANVEALHLLGCEMVVSLSLAGALSERFDTGMTVLYDDVLDFRKTAQSFFGPGEASHVSVAPLVCPPLHNQLVSLAAAHDLPFGGTMAVIEGPRFATRAESKMYASCGGELICQTIAPECFLVRERKMCWAGICLVSDRDTRDLAAPVSTPLIFQNMERFRERHAANLHKVIAGLRSFDCACRRADISVPRQRTDALTSRAPSGEGNIS